MVSTAPVAQSASDILKKLWKPGSFTGMNTTLFLEVASKVFVNCDREAQKEADTFKTGFLF